MGSWMRRQAVAAASIMAAMVVLPTLAVPASAGPGSVVHVRHDRGGEVIRYALRTREIAQSGKKVRISGPCDSACTLHLSVPRQQLCITKGASFGFHLPYGGSTRSNETARRYLWRSYPGWVKSWISQRGGLTSGIKRMDYAYASRYLPECRTTQRQTFAFRSAISGPRQSPDRD